MAKNCYAFIERIPARVSINLKKSRNFRIPATKQLTIIDLGVDFTISNN